MEIARFVVLALVFAVGTAFYRVYMSRSDPTRLSRRAAALGFLPQSAQNTLVADPDPALERAMAAAARGRWEPAARLLAATREQRDWARRARYTEAFGTHQAALAGSWLHSWEAAAGPDDPDAALVRAEATVSLAWERRGGGWAKDTSPEQFAGFHSTLARSPALNARAAELNPGDPSPYISELRTARGLGYSHEGMRQVWKEVTVRDPYHYGAHCEALKYWYAKWHGSDELVMAFARDAAATAPPGTLLTALPLIVWYGQHDDDAKAADFRAPHLVAQVDAVLADVTAAGPGHPHVAQVRHLLAYFLSRQGRWEAALEQFRQVDGYVNALPWHLWNDPAANYCLWRDQAVRGGRRR